MFGSLKKKLKGFVEKLTGKEESKEESQEEKIIEPAIEEQEAKPVKKEAKVSLTKKALQKEESEEPTVEGQREKAKPIKKEVKKSTAEAISEKDAVGERQEKRTEKEKQEKIAPPAMEEKKERQEREDKEASPKKEIKAKVGVVSKIKALATGYVELSEKELEPALDELELSLLEADVAYDVVEEIIANLKRDLVGKPLAKDRVQEAVRESIRKTLLSYLEDGKDVVELVRSSNKRPYVILFFGINGAGKTTTIAKIAHLLQGAGFSVVMAAADTFRAAAIEQLEEHANKLSLKAIKSSYGSHPASVVHNAIEHAKNKGVDVVLVDTAGRQDVNLSLMKELEKVVRVAKPDLRLFVGESTSGNALYEQVKTYKELVGIDGVILTKLDLDPKGGTAISVGKATGVPIYYITTGQGYEDIERFSRDWLIKRLF